MIRRGNCHDNVVMEAFFSSLKTELADRFESRAAAKMALFDYFEGFYPLWLFLDRYSTKGLIRTESTPT
jgi:transposase InsO family protein